jgi:hypothetical protein
MGTEISTQTRPSGLALQSFDDAWRFWQMVAKTDFAPKDFKGKPEACLLAGQHGAELGLGPMQSLQCIAVVNGRPTVWGDAALALVQSSPVCEYVAEKVEGDGENMVAICTAKRRGYPEATAVRFSVADAKKAALWGKSGPWSQYPRRMLQLRARGFALRDAFPDVLKGLVTAEEAQDYPLPEPAREPVVIRPKFVDETPAPQPSEGRVVLNPKAKHEMPLDVAGRARLAIASATSVGKLDDVRRLLDTRLAEGAIATDEHAELVAMSLERAAMLDGDTEHHDGDESGE